MSVAADAPLAAQEALTPRRAAVLGKPIAHSLSPALHRAAYAHLGLDGWSYGRHEVDEDGLAGFVAGLDGSWAGLSLTMPLKRAVLPLLDTASQVVEQTGAANTLVLGEQGRHGDNTDVPGIVSSLTERGATRADEPVVLGGGATAASALAALAQMRAGSVRIVARRPDAVAELAGVAERCGLVLTHVPWDPAQAVAALVEADVVVATAPAGAADSIAAALPGGLDGVLLDVVYAPWPTRLASVWTAAGGGVSSGLDLLVHQATHQVVAMTRAQVAAGDLVAPMRAAGEAELAARSQG